MAKYIELKQLEARIEQSRRDKMELHDIECGFLGGVMRVKKLPIGQILDLLDSVDENINMSGVLEVNKEIIFKSCPMLQKKELQSGEDIAEPYDVVNLVFGDNAAEINKMAENILGMYGLGDELVDDIKNS